MPLEDYVADFQTLQELPVEDVAYAVLQLARESKQPNSVWHPQDVQHNRWMGNLHHHQQQELLLICAEGVAWLKAQGLLLELPTNNGWLSLSRKAREISTPKKFDTTRLQAEFPRALVHPAIVGTSWMLLARDEPSLAVFNAFRHLEISIREACGYDDSMYGVQMISKAFNSETGPLTNKMQGSTERQGLHNLMCGAFASYKNSHSHRIGEIRDMREAQEMVLLASHLIRIVESRASALVEEIGGR